VVFTGAGDQLGIDLAATTRLRDDLREGRGDNEPFFDRGPGYARLSGGAASPECDWTGKQDSTTEPPC
jgi:N-methylhydantoinase B